MYNIIFIVILRKMVDTFSNLIKKYPVRENFIDYSKEYSCSLSQKNQLCGDEIRLYLSLEKKKLIDVDYKENSCILVKVSADIMKKIIQGKTLTDFTSIHEYLYNAFMQINISHSVQNNYESLSKKSKEKIQDLLFIHKIPIRIQCVLLPWNTLKKAITKI